MSIGLRRFVLPAAVLMAVAAGQTVVAEPATVPARATPLTATPVSTGDRAVFVPMAQRRLLDTRSGSAVSPSAPRAVQVTGVAGIPVDALAVVVNVAAYQPAKAGYLTVYPTGSSRPVARSVSFAAREIAENVLTVKLGSGGRISVFASTVSHVVADVAGYYRNHAHDDRYLLKGEAQGRTAANALSCPAGSLIRAVAADGAPTCVQDASGPVESVGAGLLLTDGVLSAQQSRTAVNAFTCPPGHYLRAVAADGAPTCAADVDTDTDTDTDTTYQAGFGLLLDGTLLSAEQGRSAKNAFTCEEGFLLRAVAEDGTPTCDEDRFGPTYTAGFGIGIDGGTISAQQGRSAPSAFSCPPTQYLQQVAADGAPLCAADANTTYGAGHGLALNGTTFSLAEGASVVRVRGDSTDAGANGTRLRSALTSLPFVATAARPIAVVLSAGTYDLGSANMGVPAFVTLVGSGREATIITGSFGAGSSGLLVLGTGSTLASLAVKNTAGTSAAVVPVVVNGGTARIYDVAGTATTTAAGPTAFGLVVFSDANVVVERSTFTATAHGSAYGVYAVAATLRGTDVEATATSGTGAAYGAAAGSGAIVELAGGALVATSTAGGTPYVAGELGASDIVRVAHAKLVGGLFGTPTCVGAYDAAFAPRTC